MAKRWLGLVVADTVGLVWLLFAGSSGATSSGGCAFDATTGRTTSTFSYAGAEEAWVVSSDVASAVFDVCGAAGGSLTSSGVELTGGSGGLGGHVQATVELTPRKTLYVLVGGKGGDGVSSPDSCGTGGGCTVTVAGGFNGGGTNQDSCSNCGFIVGAGGGGTSDVRTSGDGLGDRLLVASGGRGAGAGSFPLGSHGDGGASATRAPSVTYTNVVTTTCSGGSGGTLVGPGAGGGGSDFPDVSSHQRSQPAIATWEETTMKARATTRTIGIGMTPGLIVPAAQSAIVLGDGAAGLPSALTYKAYTTGEAHHDAEQARSK